MGVTALSRTQAWTPGADLWVVGLPEQSSWALKIDWELNFQILRAFRHHKPDLSPELAEVLKKTGLSTLSVDKSQAPLLVAADLNFPCRWVLSLPRFEPKALQSVWTDLGRPRTRVFWPQTQSVEGFTNLWAADAGLDDFQIVLE